MTPLPLPLRTHPPGIGAADDSGRPLTLRTYWMRQQGVVLIFLHGGDCSECLRLVRDLEVSGAEIESWDSAILVMRSSGTPLPIGYLQGRQSADDRWVPNSSDRDVAIAVIDFRGRLMGGWTVSHPEPVDWREITETVRWAAIQEPECGTCVIAPAWDA